MQVTSVRPAFCIAQRCGGAPHVAMHKAHFGHLQAVRTSRNLAVLMKATPEEELDAEFEGLAPEDDFEIPGGYRDAMTSNTPLGKAVKEACGELDTLAALERETLEEADALLKKLGLKSSIFDVPKTDNDE